MSQVINPASAAFFATLGLKLELNYNIACIREGKQYKLSEVENNECAYKCFLRYIEGGYDALIIALFMLAFLQRHFLRHIIIY